MHICNGFRLLPEQALSLHIPLNGLQLMVYLAHVPIKMPLPPPSQGGPRLCIDQSLLPTVSHPLICRGETEQT